MKLKQELIFYPAKIDEVYNLYDLTPEEIKIVEENNQ